MTTFSGTSERIQDAQTTTSIRLAHDHDQVRHDGDTQADLDKALREAEKVLSEDGRLVLAALSEKIDRQMIPLDAHEKAQMKTHAASELIKKERLEGPIVLSLEQKQIACAPRPLEVMPRAEPAPVSTPRTEPEAPRQTLRR